MVEPSRSEVVLQLLRKERHGVLCTLSRKEDGWPFGSVVPYALSEANDPILLMSGLAEHTQNVLADDRVSLFLQDSAYAADPQTGPRATLLGRLERVSDAQTASVRERYLQRIPEAASLFELGDFHLFILRVTRIRYIGGFGAMFWMPGEELRERG